MRIATWNVNSVTPRVPRLLPWLDQRAPDVVCLQETKLGADAFGELLGNELASRGYEFAHNGQGQWNGVALLSRVGLSEVVHGLPDGPGFPEADGPQEARAISGICGTGDDAVRVYSVYVPNGREVDSDHYHYKLAWLEKLRADVAQHAASTLICGDVNIAPSDADLFDPASFEGHTHITDRERNALAAIEAQGLSDVVREHWPNDRVFSYWDYRAGMFHKDLGMRIDLILAGTSVTPRVQAAWVDRQSRKGTKPSDHAAVIVDLDVAPDGDVGPMVPPPSNPAKPGGKTVKLPHSVGE